MSLIAGRGCRWPPRRDSVSPCAPLSGGRDTHDGHENSPILVFFSNLLEQRPNPNDDQIDATITNICRCGTFARVRRAIHALADENQGRPLWGNGHDAPLSAPAHSLGVVSSWASQVSCFHPAGTASFPMTLSKRVSSRRGSP